MPITQPLLHGVVFAEVISRAHGPSFARHRELHSAVDVTLPMSDDSGDSSERLQSVQPLLADPVNQFTSGVVERDLILHREAHASCERCGKEIIESPGPRVVWGGELSEGAPCARLSNSAFIGNIRETREKRPVVNQDFP
jgi:hypothetical protein